MRIENGTILMCDLGVRNTSIQRGLRPCVVVSNNKANAFSNVIMVIPLTTKISKIYPTQCLIKANEKNNMKLDSLALCEQITPVNKLEQVEFIIGKVTDEEMNQINKSMMIALGMLNPSEATIFDLNKVRSELNETTMNIEKITE